MEKIIDIGKSIINKRGGIDNAIKFYVEQFKKLRKRKEFKKNQINKHHLKIGNVYYFEYYNKDEFYALNDSKKPFFDKTPTGILIGKNKKEITLIDLNVIPYHLKLRVFELINLRYKYFIERNVKNDVNKWIDFVDLESFLIKNVRFDIKLAYVKYDLSYIREIYGISWSDMDMLLFLNDDENIYYNKKTRINKNTIIRLFLKNIR